MKLYIAIRWGNHDSPDGPDGADTHFLIRAHNSIEAARLADEILRSMPVSSPNHKREVQPFCHKVIEIGSDGSAFSDVEPQVLIGPWIAYCYAVHNVGYGVWNRDHNDENAWTKET
jgi:hypothetical protein